jgi:hypothetical protein
MHKSVSSYRDGYKAHVAVEPETGIVTAAALTPGPTPPMGPPVWRCWPASRQDWKCWQILPTGVAPPVRR